MHFRLLFVWMRLLKRSDNGARTFVNDWCVAHLLCFENGKYIETTFVNGAANCAQPVTADVARLADRCDDPRTSLTLSSVPLALGQNADAMELCKFGDGNASQLLVRTEPVELIERSTL
jgi:hypothetical protein